MPDREKVIKGLECHIHPFQCNDCPYWDKSQPLRDCDVEQMAKDALDLLREQEPVEPKIAGAEYSDTWHYACGACDGAIDPKDAYCRHCGREVKWK